MDDPVNDSLTDRRIAVITDATVPAFWFELCAEDNRPFYASGYNDFQQLTGLFRRYRSQQKSFSSSRNAVNRLPFFFWKGFALNSSSFFRIAVLSSSKEKNFLFRKAARIQVSITFTVPSALGLSFGLNGLAGMIAVYWLI